MAVNVVASVPPAAVAAVISAVVVRKIAPMELRNTLQASGLADRASGSLTAAVYRACAANRWAGYCTECPFALLPAGRC